MIWPDPDAPRSAVDEFVKKQNFEKAIVDSRSGPPHEAPQVENGPSLVCNACGIVRVGIYTPFCKGCLAQIGDIVGVLKVD